VAQRGLAKTLILVCLQRDMCVLNEFDGRGGGGGGEDRWDNWTVWAWLRKGRESVEKICGSGNKETNKERKLKKRRSQKGRGCNMAGVDLNWEDELR